MKICIDSGHNYSGYDTGAQGNGLREQDITYKIAARLAELLKSIGLSVIMTRPTLETNLGTSLNDSINKRVQISNSNGCDYFVSIHCNAGGGIGTETLIYAKGGKAEVLAKYVQDSVITKLGTRNRGIKEQNVGVLRLTNSPAILVETAFIDNVSDAELLKNRQNDFAQAIFEGICKYLGITVKTALTLSEMKAYIASKCGFSDPQGVWSFMDKHPYAADLYQKWYNSYR